MPPNHPWPTTHTNNITNTLHNQTIADPYRWLENEQAPEVRRG